MNLFYVHDKRKVFWYFTILYGSLIYYKIAPLYLFMGEVAATLPFFTINCNDGAHIPTVFGNQKLSIETNKTVIYLSWSDS